MKLEQLIELMKTGQFHHATYRNMGTLWEGLHIYIKDEKGFRGFEHIGFFSPRTNPKELEMAMEIVKRTGYSVGSYGRG